MCLVAVVELGSQLVSSRQRYSAMLASMCHPLWVIPLLLAPLLVRPQVRLDVHDASKGMLYTMACVADVSEARYKKSQVSSNGNHNYFVTVIVTTCE